jgi:hypothetical protein
MLPLKGPFPHPIIREAFQMLGLNLIHLIEANAEQLARSLAEKLRTSSRTTHFRQVPETELQNAALEVYRNLGDWLLSKTEGDVELRYKRIGMKRVAQGIPASEYVWAIVLSRENLWAFLQRQGLSGRAIELYGELELMQTLTQFFERALYYGMTGYEETRGSGHSELEKVVSY